MWGGGELFLIISFNMIVTLVIPKETYAEFEQLTTDPRKYMEEVLIRHMDELEEKFPPEVPS